MIISADIKVYAGRIKAAQAALSVRVGDVNVFDSAIGKIYWSAAVMVGGVDVSARLVGDMKIEADEDSARLASFSVIPLSDGELASYDSAAVTIDLTIYRGSAAASLRRFTGVVETVSFNPSAREAALNCRDGYQERIRACASAAQIHSLLGGMSAPCSKIVAWSDSTPDPSAYFSSLLATLPGATFIDASGIWQAIKWDISPPLVTFTAADVFEDSMSITQPSRADVPSAIFAQLTHRFPRLHCAEVAIDWAEPDRTDYVVQGIVPCTKSAVIEAIKGISGWVVKGDISITPPVPGSYPVPLNGHTVYYNVSYAEIVWRCSAMSATLYRRWYQEVEIAYSVTIAMDGASDRDESIQDAIATTFDTGSWESPSPTSDSLGIYSANAPAGQGDVDPPTGYEALPAPWPPANSAMDHFADVTAGMLAEAASHVVAKATRLAAAGRRKRRVDFERPIDPRWEIGATLAVTAYGVFAAGQLAGFADTLNFESGEATTKLIVACPQGGGTNIDYTASVTPPAPNIAHALLMPALGNHVGADLSTPDQISPDSLAGYLCNTIPTSISYDASAPVFEPQFRIVTPAIDAAVRDPLYLTAVIDATVSLPAGELTISF